MLDETDLDGHQLHGEFSKQIIVNTHDGSMGRWYIYIYIYLHLVDIFYGKCR